MVPYAGKTAREPTTLIRQRRAYAHFQLGRDTLAISEIMKVKESTAFRWIHAERERIRIARKA